MIFLAISYFLSVLNRRAPFWAITALVVVIALIWEIFEYQFGISYSPEGYSIDTIIDLIVAVLGAVIAKIIDRLLIRSHE